MKKKNIAIIQARMNSSRLPRKMFKKIGKYTIIEWVIKRLKKVKSIDKIILATSKKKIDKKLKTISKKLNIDYFTGSEKDVLGRFVATIKGIKEANIIRICADNPFIDPSEIKKLITFYKKKNYDYVCNRQVFSKIYADGFGAEIFSINLLRKLNKLVKNKNLREHVTLYLWKNKKKFKIHSLKSNKFLAYPHLKFDVDTKEDLNFLKKIAQYKIGLNTSAKNIIKIAKKLN